MVKADVRRDYYADLGVSPSADTDEIKKQFRKLALKYHPDRNPGREAEFNAKFQAIQAAHEILSDPQQRLKYDTERLRAGYGKLYGPPPSNGTRRTTTSSYPAAASGKAPTAKASFPQRASYQAPPSSGAQRYASYAKAAPQQPWEKVYESQTRADAFRGFQEMKSSANMPGWSKFDPRTGKPAQQSGRSTPTSMPTSSASRMKSAYEHFNSKQASPTGPSRSQSTRKKQGFAPGTPGGDEPMARNVSSYTSVPRADRSSAFFDSVPKKSDGESSRSATPQEDHIIPELERTSTRYATTGGERTYFSSAGLGRSISMREPSSGSPRARPRTNPPSPTSPPSGRHHSASPELKAHRNRTFSDSTSSSDISEDEPLPSKPKATPKSRLRPNQKVSDFYSPKDWNPGFGRDSESTAFTFRSEYTFPTAEAAKNDTQGKSAGDYNNNNNGEKKNSSDFFGESGKTFMNGGPKSKSHEHLNKRFSASEWNGVFQGGTSPTRGRSATRADSAAQYNVAPSSDDSSKPQQPAPFAPGKFSADAWAQQLRDNTWAVPHPEIGKQQANPRSSRSPRKASRTTLKPATRPQPATVSSEAEEEETTVFERNNHAFPGTPEAMDIDEEPPSKAEVPPVNGASAESNKSTSQPNAAPMPNKTGSKSSPDNGEKANGTKNDLFNLKPLNNVAPFTTTNSSGIDDLKDIHANLPFESRPNNPNIGRRVVRPRELNLPNPPKRPRPPVMVPAGPDSSQKVLPQKAWDRYVAEMTAYMREWNEFNRLMLRHFNARQDAVETGLAPKWISAVGDSTRLNVNAEDGGARDADGGSEVDDTDDNLVPGQPTGGFNAYLRGVEEDFKVRQHWEVSWERHRACILELGEIRDWIRNGGKVVA
ncbi:hypothetical protein VTN77DRAFT_702 [Rasamsonia byssochlamydoides]|uniref:uncharacterized protein n=1 Tax=Rasamsonia byssochlamydoides TaxID=89139 RepID=UPI003742F925